ncbi:hypothetical protein VTJ04DRAFT_6448 [Mycothermus thermophilus]|uniref:uncharacterized protein n=1 Tax=Humicola insolens TaxID=85995 RepID=UPI00374378F9
MASQTNNPFGAPPQVLQNPFGAPAASKQQSPFANPFGNAKPNPFGAQANNPFGAPTQANKPQVTAQQPSSISNQHLKNPRGTPPTGPKSRTPSPFGRAKQSEQSGAQGAAQSDSNTMARRGKFAGLKTQLAANANGGFGGKRSQTQGQGTQRTTPFSGSKGAAKQTNSAETEPPTKVQRKQPVRQERYQPPPRKPGAQVAAEAGPGERTKELSVFAYDYANKLYDHLKKEGIHPPKLPADIGNPDKRAAVESLKDAYKKYRAKVYASLRKADLIDDPEKRRKLEDALPFKGICEDMCPDYEKVCRIAEFDVKTEEKEARPDGLTMWPDPSRMVKKFGRSAAGQDAPLPMDVRSIDALRRTTDYLFNDLLKSEENLPAMHNFLWDRTRAVRKDFTFHSQKSAEEMKDMVYCFETITRFHATALHLLSRKGFAHDDFDQKQEIEQLGRTILSLMEAYDVCREKRVHCENEPEFRAYYLLLNAHDPSIAKRIPTWGKEYWFESEEVQTALSLIQAMDDVREPKGPIKPRRPTTLSDTSFANYFAIVEDPRVSYTMACIAEIHFTTVRQSILKNLVRAYARRRDAPRTITASDLNRLLRFDTPEEAVEFAELHDFEFSEWVPEGKNPVSEPYLLLNSRKKFVPSPRVRQSFSGQLVERKRKGQSLTHVIYHTIYEEGGEPELSSGSQANGMFVTQSPALKELAASTAGTNSPFGQQSSATSIFGNAPSTTLFESPAAALAPATTTTPFGGFPAAQQPSPTAAAPNNNPFASTFQPAAQTGATFSFGTSPAPAPSGPLPTFQQPQQPSSLFTPYAKPAEASKPFSFLGGSDPPKTTAATPAAAPPPLQPAQTTGTQSASSLLNFGSATPASSSIPAAPATGGTAVAQAKPVEQAPSSALGTTTTPLAGASIFMSPQTNPPSQQPTTTLSIPSILVTSPTTTTPPTQSAAALFSSGTAPSSVGLPAATPALSVSPSTTTPAAPPPPPPPPPAPKRDLFGDFTKWFVLGDEGLLGDFTEDTLNKLLWDVWVKFQEEEAERKRREEDEESWRLAREHMAHRLSVKYFYRWRERARARATRRVLREQKEAMRQYREQQRLIQQKAREEQEKAEQEARRKSKRQVMEDMERISLLASSRNRRPSITYSVDGAAEEQLIASGIFSGMGSDPRSLARRVVRGPETAADSWAGASDTRSLRYPESELELEPASRSARGSPGASSIGSRSEGGKTLKLRQKFNLDVRRSLSACGSVINGGGSLASSISKFRQSLKKTTNFASAKQGSGVDTASEDGFDLGLRRSTSSNHGSDTPGSKPRTKHWELRLRGLVPMPDGNWLPEALARRTRNKTSIVNGPASISSDNLSLHDHDIFLPDAYPHPPPSSHGGRASPTPSELRLKLERLKNLTTHSPPRRSFDESVSEARLQRILASTSTTSMPPPPIPVSRQSLANSDIRTAAAGGKRKRTSDVDALDFDDDHDHDDHLHGEQNGGLSGTGVTRKVSPSARKKALLESHLATAVGGSNTRERSASVTSTGTSATTKAKGVLALREETRSMISDASAKAEETQRMLRELRAMLDQADRKETEEVVEQGTRLRGGGGGGPGVGDGEEVIVIED